MLDSLISFALGPTALVVTVVMYLITAVAYWVRGDYSLVGVFVCYAVANGFFVKILLR